MPHTSRTNNLQEVTDRNRTARRIIAGFATTYPTLAHYWQTLATALDDTAALSVELRYLNTALIDLQAAGLATLSAHKDGEADPLFYLCDELRAQGHDIDRRRAW